LKKRPFKEIRNKIADISQVSIEKMIREYSKEEAVRLMKVIMENNMTMLKLQKQILKLQVTAEEKKRRQEDREQRRREEKEQRRQKEKEEEEQRKRVDEKWRRVEEMRVQEKRRVEKE